MTWKALRVFFSPSEDKPSLLDSAIPDGTKAATKYWMSVPAEFAHEKGIAVDLSSIEEAPLARFLEQRHDQQCSSSAGETQIAPETQEKEEARRPVI